MQDIFTMLGTLRRPRILLRAARLGAKEYNRERHLRRVLAAEPPRSAAAILRLLELERSHDEQRRAEENEMNQGLAEDCAQHVRLRRSRGVPDRTGVCPFLDSHARAGKGVVSIVLCVVGSPAWGGDFDNSCVVEGTLTGIKIGIGPDRDEFGIADGVGPSRVGNIDGAPH